MSLLAEHAARVHQKVEWPPNVLLLHSGPVESSDSNLERKELFHRLLVLSVFVIECVVLVWFVIHIQQVACEFAVDGHKFAGSDGVDDGGKLVLEVFNGNLHCS